MGVNSRGFVMKKYKAKSLFLLLSLSVVLLLSGCGNSSVTSEPYSNSSQEPGEIEKIDLSSVGITDEVCFDEYNIEDTVYVTSDGTIGFVYPDNEHQNDTSGYWYYYCGEGQLSDCSFHDGYVEMKLNSVKTDYYRFSQGSDELLEENVKVDNAHFEDGDEIILYLSGAKASVIPQSLLDRDEGYQFYSSIGSTPGDSNSDADTIRGCRFYNKTKDIYIAEVSDYGI